MVQNFRLEKQKNYGIKFAFKDVSCAFMKTKYFISQSKKKINKYPQGSI